METSRKLAANWTILRVHKAYNTTLDFDHSSQERTTQSGTTNTGIVPVLAKQNVHFPIVMEQSRIALRRQLMTTKHYKSLHCTDDVTKELFRLFNKMNVVARVVDLALGFKVGVRCQLGALGSHLF